MPFSHRDLRAHRDVGRSAAAVLAGLVGLIALAVRSPSPVLGVAAVFALGVLGLLAAARGSSLVREYENDVRSVLADPSPRLGALGVEVRSSVALQPSPSSPTRRSPNTRRPIRRASAMDLPGPRTDPSG
ncbi:MAG: hypothetical protein L3K08_08235 [Thermoplasmata archaeon]|nr:hypothetical protein [Thermoplasmata archaeon]